MIPLESRALTMETSMEVGSGSRTTTQTLLGLPTTELSSLMRLNFKE